MDRICITEQGLSLIRRFGGFGPTIYICPAGYPTIGYRHVVLTHERELFVRGVTADELVSFTFNLGAGAV